MQPGQQLNDHLPVQRGTGDISNSTGTATTKAEIGSEGGRGEPYAFEVRHAPGIPTLQVHL